MKNRRDKKRPILGFSGRVAASNWPTQEADVFYSVVRPLVRSLTLVFCTAYAVAEGEPTASNEGVYQFDESLLVGKPVPIGGLDKFKRAHAVAPGVYQLDVLINGRFFTKQSIRFLPSQQGEVLPCLAESMLLDAGVLPEKIRKLDQPSLSTENVCRVMKDMVDGASSQFDLSRLRLDLLVPQAMMKRTPRGAVPQGDLDAGETMGFVNYDANYYRSDTDSMTSHSAYLNLNAGFNLGLWRLHQQSSYNYSDSNGMSLGRWKNLRSYVQRAIPEWQSQLTLGDSYTQGTLFGSLGFRGIQISSDDRMMPDSLRGYAPTIRGVAVSNAKVSVRQAGLQIYQTTVAPGPFIIDDLYPTSYQGDLDVSVEEADGRVTSFTVPFSAVPESIRPGHSRINFSAGQVRHIGDSQDVFGDVTHQMGVNNALTINSGLRLAKGYQSALLGGVLALPVGALGLNTAYSRAGAADDSSLHGWRFAATYSSTFAPMGTTLSLAGYRYSTEGYRELADVLGVRSIEGGGQWASSTYQQRSQLTATISQSLWRYGQLYLSSSTSDYRDGRSRDTQYQLAYSHSYQGISYNLSLSRQRVGAINYGVQTPGALIPSDQSQSMLMFSLSMPLGNGGRSPVFSSSISHQSGGLANTNYQTALAGTLGDMQNFSYSANASYDSEGTGAGFGVSAQQQFSAATLGGSFSKGKNFIQSGLSLRGGAVAHSGGVTFGPYLGETFGLIEAVGAEGASVRNGMGAQVDRYGYAIVPSLVPYRYNDVSLDTKSVVSNVELSEGEQRVAPHAGASVKLRFKTLQGNAWLIKSKQLNGDALPLGANVLSEAGVVVGLVGQNSQIYARAEGDTGRLLVSWGDKKSEQCWVSFDLNTQQDGARSPLLRLDAPCLPALAGPLNRAKTEKAR